MCRRRAAAADRLRLRRVQAPHAGRASRRRGPAARLRVRRRRAGRRRPARRAARAVGRGDGHLRRRQRAPRSARRPRGRVGLRAALSLRRHRRPLAPMQELYRLLDKVIESRLDGAGQRRERHRQGADRARHPLQLAARPRALRRAELQRVQRQPPRLGAVRPQEGRVHRRHRRQAGSLRGRRPGHLLPRRDWRHVAGAAGQGAARAAGGNLHARRRHGAAHGRRAHHRGHQPRPQEDGREAASSARTSTTASTSSS